MPTELPAERAIAVGVSFDGQDPVLNLDDSLRELALLADTAGVRVVAEVTQHLPHPDPKTFIRAGKLAELKAFIEELRADVVIFDDELSPRHSRELDTELGRDIKLLDRTALILDIFAQHANTREGALQVELAQYEYRLPRLTRAWTHLARQAGGAASQGGVGLRGPGETQLEVDRRDIGRRISYLKRRIEKVRAHRSRHRQQRKRSAIPTVALVGYTNAGKSTLLNTLTDANVYAADQLFATLDPTTRRVNLGEGGVALFTDTVGFIQKLPTQLIAAFRATLEEVSEADLLLHIVDASHPNVVEQHRAVVETLATIGAGDIPVMVVLNKADLLDATARAAVCEMFPEAVLISAHTGEGIEALLLRVRAEILKLMLPVEVFLPYTEGRLVSLMFEQGEVDHREERADGVYMLGRVPSHLLGHYENYLTAAEDLANGPLLNVALSPDDEPDYDWEDIPDVEA